MADLLMLAASWGLRTSDAGFDPRCDLHNDAAINVVDLLYLANNWGT